MLVQSLVPRVCFVRRPNTDVRCSGRARAQVLACLPTQTKSLLEAGDQLAELARNYAKLGGAAQKVKANPFLGGWRGHRSLVSSAECGVPCTTPWGSACSRRGAPSCSLNAPLTPPHP